MKIGAINTSLINTNNMNLDSQIGMKMLDKNLEMGEQMGVEMVEMMKRSMELSVNPFVGGNFDMSI